MDNSQWPDKVLLQEDRRFMGSVNWFGCCLTDTSRVRLETMYRGLESLSVRQQVVNVREVTSPAAKIIAFSGISRTIAARTCSRENLHWFFVAQIPKISLNAKSRIQVCAPTWRRRVRSSDCLPGR